MQYDTYQKVTGVIRNIRRGNTCCTQIISLQTTEEDTIHFILSGETVVIENVRLRKGMRIAAFYDSILPAPAIFPPQYQAQLITVLRREQEVMLNYFDENLIAEDNSLKLNLTPLTNVMTANGQRFPCTPINAELLVYYTTTTFSLPPQTTPQKIIVLCPYE